MLNQVHSAIMMEKVLNVILFRAAQSCALNRLVKADSKVEYLKFTSICCEFIVKADSKVEYLEFISIYQLHRLHFAHKTM